MRCSVYSWLTGVVTPSIPLHASTTIPSHVDEECLYSVTHRLDARLVPSAPYVFRLIFYCARIWRESVWGSRGINRILRSLGPLRTLKGVPSV
jgi:hypothetical protein